ncbi:MAG: IS481 family transposase [Solirubrobacterales bacterium]
MRCHANARLSPIGRRLLIDRIEQQGWRVTDAAEASGISERTARKWLARWRAEGELGLLDRSSAPRTVANKTPVQTVEAVAALRRLRMSSPEIADVLGRPLSTVCAVLKRLGMNRLGRLGLEPTRRYEHELPGAMIHTDIKKLGAITVPGHRVTGNRKIGGRRTTYTPDGRRVGDAGWEFVHIAIDDASRLAYAEVLADEKATTAVGFLRRAVAFFERHGIQVQRLLTDNGSAYRSAIHAIACKTLNIKHSRTRPRRPQTNGKAERFIRTMLGGWAYSAIYRSSTERTQALDGWIYHYNHHRPHQAIGRQPPITRLNNLLGTYT